MKLTITTMVAVLTTVLFTTAACAGEPAPTPDAATDQAKQTEELRRENIAIREELSALQSEMNKQAQETTMQTASKVEDICSRSPAIQKELLNELGIPSCAHTTIRELLRLTELSFSYSGEESTTGDLDGLSNLTTLRLYIPDHKPPDNLLRDLTKLQNLTLEHGRICGESLTIPHKQLKVEPMSGAGIGSKYKCRVEMGKN